MKYFFVILLIFIVLGGGSSAFAVHDEDTTRGVDDPKIAVSGSGVYVVWNEGTNPEYSDLFFVKSSDGGATFDETPVNLTNGISLNPDPKITVSENNVYVVWEDKNKPDGIDVIYFTKSNDGGKTFDEPRILDPINDPLNLIFRPIEILESNDILYIFASQWNRQTNDHSMIFLTSNDNGDTFSEHTVLFESGKWDDFIDFEVDNDEKTIYVVTDDKKNYDEKGDLNLRKIFADGTLSEIIKVNGGNTAVTTAEFAISEDNVYVVWRAWENNRWHITFTKSNDQGESFEKPVRLNSDPNSIDSTWSQGSHIFAIDNLVYITWPEEYWDGETQWFHYWTATSDNRGEDFEVSINPLDDLLEQYGQVMTVQQDKYIYSMAMTIKNPPFNDAALYLAQSEDGKSFSEPVDVLKDNPPAFRFSDITTNSNGIHFVAEGNYESNCILYTSTQDMTAEYYKMKSLSPNGSSKHCLGIEDKIQSPKQQMEKNTEIENTKCKEERSKGYILAFRENNKQPVCVTAVNYEKMINRNIISENSFEIIAHSAAKNYLLSHPKISENIIVDSLELEIYMTRHSIPPAFIIKGSFDSNSSIYDRDSDPNTHNVEMAIVLYNQIHYAVIDEAFVLTESKDDSLQKRNPRANTIVSPTIETILSPGDRVNNKGLIPLLITEVSQGGYDNTTHWTFQSIGYHGDNRDKLWGILPDSFRITETVDQNGEDAIDRERIPENFGVPMPLFVFPLLCNGEERIEGESGWHYTLPTRTDTENVYFRSTDKGIYPDENGIYSIKFVSMFKPSVELLPNTEIIKNETILCPFEKPDNDATHAYYTNLQFKIDDDWSIPSFDLVNEKDIEKIKTHQRATLLVEIFGDKFDFSRSEYQLQSPQINFELAEENLIQRYSDDATLGFFFETLGMKLDAECFVFPDKREFCNNEEYSLKFYINDEKKNDISQYLIIEKDRILISYGPESDEDDVAEQIKELKSMAQFHYESLEQLMSLDVGTVREGTYDEDLGFQTAVKLMEFDMKRQEEKNILQNTINQKQYQYDILVSQNEDSSIYKPLLIEIKQHEEQLKNISENMNNNQYSTEEIFNRVNEIEAENIKMYKIGPEEFKIFTTTKKTLENAIKEFPLMNPPRKQKNYCRFHMYKLILKQKQLK